MPRMSLSTPILSKMWSKRCNVTVSSTSTGYTHSRTSSGVVPKRTSNPFLDTSSTSLKQPSVDEFLEPCPARAGTNQAAVAPTTEGAGFISAGAAHPAAETAQGAPEKPRTAYLALLDLSADVRHHVSASELARADRCDFALAHQLHHRIEHPRHCLCLCAVSSAKCRHLHFSHSQHQKTPARHPETIHAHHRERHRQTGSRVHCPADCAHKGDQEIGRPSGPPGPCWTALRPKLVGHPAAGQTDIRERGVRHWRRHKIPPRATPDQHFSGQGRAQPDVAGYYIHRGAENESFCPRLRSTGGVSVALRETEVQRAADHQDRLSHVPSLMGPHTDNTQKTIVA
ncbi:hypothetical protein KL944_002921 [Ogataea haglerorum]|nr:hypothetical protein KL944_002921 [Ogataea haglerorum]